MWEILSRVLAGIWLHTQSGIPLNLRLASQHLVILVIQMHVFQCLIGVSCCCALDRA